MKTNITQIPNTQIYVEKTVLSTSQTISAFKLNSSNSDCIKVYEVRENFNNTKKLTHNRLQKQN